MTVIDQSPPKGAEERKEAAVGYVHTTNLPELLKQLKISLLVTTYQAQRILAFSAQSEKLFMLMRIFDRPTGIAINGPEMAMYAKNKVWFFRAAGVIRDVDGNVQPYDLCYAPRKSYVTGDISGHEIAYIGNTLHVVNTRFSCISVLSDEFSFTPVWKPRFIPEISPEDCCHLNGIASDASGIRYVSALGETSTKEGWRENKASGGIIIDYRSGEVIARGLSMPHSPRLYANRLWILNSGYGELQTVDPATGNRQTVARLPGFLRGLTFIGNIAVIGLCKIREKKTFGDLPIETMVPELQCGIHFIDIRNGASLGFITFTKGIEELFDIHVLPGVANPHIIGFEEETVNGLFVLDPGGQKRSDIF